MKNSQVLLIATLLFGLSGCNDQNIYIDKLTNINPVSYTDVVYTGVQDTVLVSTYSGRVSKIIRGIDKEVIIAEIPDEIYALAYNPKRKEIAAATLESGILLINENDGKIIKELRLKSTWAISVSMSADLNYLFANDLAGNQYIWEVNKNYTEHILPDSLHKGKIVRIDDQHIAAIIGVKNVFYWDLNINKLQKEIKVELGRFGDMDQEGDFLSIDFNECSKYRSDSPTIVFTVKHPNWPLANVENEKEIFDIPYSMQLTGAKFARDKIFTASIDRTIRVWDRGTGALLKTLSGHKATVDKIAVSKDQTQLVSVDLKGGIKFWKVD